jgi:hypothetical protein
VRQEDHEFKASLGYMEKLFQKPRARGLEIWFKQ